MNSIIKEDCINYFKKSGVDHDIFNKTFLITGSNGLIGNYIVSLLSVANNMYSANIKAHCISKHAPIWKEDNFNYISQDLSRPFSFQYPVDYIIHCACYARPKKFLANELETIALNVDATKILLEIARVNKARFLFLSSSETYGNPPPQEIPTKETYPGNSLTSSNRAAYIESKKLGETLCYIYNRSYATEARVARVGPIYGPGISIQDERVMGNIMKKAIVEKHVQLMDSGRSLRSFCYVTDAVNMLLKIVVHGKDILYNVGGGDVVSIYQMAQIIASICGATCETGSGSGMKDAPDFVKVDNSKICNEFNINSFISFKDGIKRVIDWNLAREN